MVKEMVEIQVFRISSPGSAIYRAKRWFYARFYTPAQKAGKTEVAEKNKEKWAELARKIVEKLQGLGREHAVRMQIVFDTKVVGYSKDSKGNLIKIEEFIPLAVRIEKYRFEGEELIELVEGAGELLKEATVSREEEA